MADMRVAKEGRCPQCGKVIELSFRPFCSRRCAHLDLSKWLGEEYRVPAVESPDDFIHALEEMEDQSP